MAGARRRSASSSALAQRPTAASGPLPAPSPRDRKAPRGASCTVGAPRPSQRPRPPRALGFAGLEMRNIAASPAAAPQRRIAPRGASTSPRSRGRAHLGPRDMQPLRQRPSRTPRGGSHGPPRSIGLTVTTRTTLPRRRSPTGVKRHNAVKSRVESIPSEPCTGPENEPTRATARRGPPARRVRVSAPSARWQRR